MLADNDLKQLSGVSIGSITDYERCQGVHLRGLLAELESVSQETISAAINSEAIVLKRTARE